MAPREDPPLPPPPPPPPPPRRKKLKWKNCAAKVIMYDHLKDGIISYEAKDTPSPKTIYEMYFKDLPEFQVWEYKNFCGRFRSLQKVVKKKSKMNVRDKAAFLADRLVFPERQHQRILYNGQLVPFWKTSKARETLMDDMDAGFDLSMCPKELWLSEDEYQLFPLEVFRNHIYHERHRRKDNCEKKTKVKSRNRT